jgi:hypothetical protein
MAVVIRLDVAALQSLIESGGEEFKLEITSAVLNEAIKRTCKTVMNDQRIKEKVEQEVARVVHEEIGVITSAWGRDVTLKAPILNQIKEEARKVAANMLPTIQQIMTKYAASRQKDYEDAIKRAHEQAAQAIEEQALQAALDIANQKITAAVEKMVENAFK